MWSETPESMIHSTRVKELKKPKGKLLVWEIRLLEFNILILETNTSTIERGENIVILFFFVFYRIHTKITEFLAESSLY